MFYLGVKMIINGYDFVLIFYCVCVVKVDLNVLVNILCLIKKKYRVFMKNKIYYMMFFVVLCFFLY